MSEERRREAEEEGMEGQKEKNRGRDFERGRGQIERGEKMRNHVSTFNSFT